MKALQLLRILLAPLPWPRSIGAGCSIETDLMEGVGIFLAFSYEYAALQLPGHIEPVRHTFAVIDPAAVSVWPAPGKGLVLPTEFAGDQLAFVIQEVVCSHHRGAGSIFGGIIGREYIAGLDLCEEISLPQAQGCHHILGCAPGLTLEKDAVIFAQADGQTGLAVPMRRASGHILASATSDPLQAA